MIRRFIALAVLAAALVIAYFLLIHYWYQPTYIFVYTDNARIDGALVNVSAESRSQVVDIPFDTGDYVDRDQTIVSLRGYAAAGPSSDISGQKYFYQYITAPVSGIVVSRWVNKGNTVSPGQQMLTIADLNDLWVIANIDETEIIRVKPGQRVDIHVDATNETLQGRVEYIVPSTTSIEQRGSSPSIVVAANSQDVPVKIIFEQKNRYRLYPGLSVEGTIYIK